MATQPALDRLKSQLLTSGLQERNNALFQVINQLIDNLRQNIDTTQAQITAIPAGATGATGPRGFPGGPGIAIPICCDGDNENDFFLPPSTYLGGTFAVPSFFATTATGTQNNFQVVLTRHTIIEWNGASNATFTGLAGGAIGYLATFKNVGIKLASFVHNSGSSTLANVFINGVTSGVTPVAPGGHITYYYNGTNWQLLDHEQGAWIDAGYNAGDYTAGGTMTWTVDLADLKTFIYKVQGASLKVIGYWDTTTITAPLASQLFVLIPGGYTVPKIVQAISAGFDNGVGTPTYNRVGVVGSTQIEIGRTDVANWTASVNNTFVRVDIEFPIN